MSLWFKIIFMNESDMQPLLIPPENWQWGDFKNNEGQKIRYGFNYLDNSHAMIVFAEGRTECIEEYFENIRHFNANGYACAIVDWQGQGLSYRLTGDNTRHHSKGFEQDIVDFEDFLNHLPAHIPKILVAHSMGANITLRYLGNHADRFKCGIVVAPMLGLKPRRTIQYLGKTILKTVQKLGWDKRHAIGQGAWNEKMAHIVKYKISSDPIRRELQPYLFKTRPELRCGGVTWGWIAEALKSIAVLQEKDNVSTIQTPLFFAIAENDAVVDNDGAMITLSQLPNATGKSYKNAEHQIHREQDKIRLVFLKDAQSFIEKHL